MTEFHEDRGLKRRMSRRAWREGKVGRRCRIAMLLLAFAAPLCALAAHDLMVSSLRPWEYDASGLLGITLVAGSVPLTVAVCLWRIGYQMASGRCWTGPGSRTATEPTATRTMARAAGITWWLGSMRRAPRSAGTRGSAWSRYAVMCGGPTWRAPSWAPRPTSTRWSPWRWCSSRTAWRPACMRRCGSTCRDSSGMLSPRSPL